MKVTADNVLLLIAYQVPQLYMYIIGAISENGVALLSSLVIN